MFRVFLKDGRSLVSYGELARVGDRVVFSMPTDVGANPALRLVDIPADQVDWDRTDRYAAVGPLRPIPRNAGRDRLHGAVESDHAHAERGR